VKLVPIVRAETDVAPTWPRIILPILALALALRLGVIPIVGFHHPDELWQYLEPAHKLVFDRWVAAWEFRAGIRTWLIPVVVAGPMWLGDVIAPESPLYIYLPRALLAVLSLTVVYYSAKLALRLSTTHAIVAGFVAATWVELVHFGSRTMSEPVSLALFFPAAYLLLKPGPDRRALFVAGLLLGLSFIVRFQHAPALAALVLLASWGRLRDRLPLVIAGGIIGLAIDGAVDLAVGETPFLWMVENFRINAVENKSMQYGVAPFWHYAIIPLWLWKMAAGPIIALAAFGARRFPILLAVALVNIVVHSFIPHKEYRFILLSTTLIVFLASIGTADLLQFVRRHRPAWIAAACAAWLAVAVTLALLWPIRGMWMGGRDLTKALQAAGSSPKVCGLALYHLDEPLSASYTHFHRDTPIYGFIGETAEGEMRVNASRFNVVLTTYARGFDLSDDYRLVKCTKLNPFHPPFCVYRRAGSCSPEQVDGFEVNNFLAAHGK
jgi:phosphatidylinositol glycan class B